LRKSFLRKSFLRKSFLRKSFFEEEGTCTTGGWGIGNDCRNEEQAARKQAARKQAARKQAATERDTNRQRETMRTEKEVQQGESEPVDPSVRVAERERLVAKEIREAGVPTKDPFDEMEWPDGMYLSLEHGYLNEADRAVMDGQLGFTGPMIGPIGVISRAYGGEMAIAIDHETVHRPTEWARKYEQLGVRRASGRLFLQWENGVFRVGGVEYGDYLIFNTG
jgi:hypothetical protein